MLSVRGGWSGVCFVLDDGNVVFVFVLDDGKMCGVCFVLDDGKMCGVCFCVR
jgi:hypothetical protein